MTDMIEKVARAMWDATDDDIRAGDAFEIIDQESKGFLRTMARAAIEAMREPSEAMVRAGAIKHEDMAEDGFCDIFDPDARAIFAEMIDAALTAHKEGE